MSMLSERPFAVEVTCTYFDVQFGLVKSQKPGVYLTESDSPCWNPVNIKKGSLIREEENLFKYTHTIAEGTNSCELNGNKVLLQASSFYTECCFRDAQTARRWFDLQLGYARNGNVAVWGSSSNVTGNWIKKTRIWKRIVGGKLQVAPSVEGAPNITPSSNWNQVDLPKHYTMNNSDESVSSISCIVNPGSPRQGKFCWDIRERAVIFTMLSNGDDRVILTKEESYPSDAEARAIFSVTKATLERGIKTEVDQSARGISSFETVLESARNESEKAKGSFLKLFKKATNGHTSRQHDDRHKIGSPLNVTQVVREDTRGEITSGIGAFKIWMSSRSSGASSSAAKDYNLLSHNSIIKSRNQDWNSAYSDAKESVSMQASAMGYIAMARAQVGMNKLEEAMQTFDFALAKCNSNESTLLLLIKFVILFMAGKNKEAIDRVNNLMTLPMDDEAMYCCIQVLGKMCMIQGDYGRALQLLKQYQDLTLSSGDRDLETISFISAWSFDGLRTTAQRCHCEVLLSTGCVQEATQILLEMVNTSDASEKSTPDWVSGLRDKCVSMLEELGDQAFGSQEYSKAIAQYTSALSLSLPNPMDILVKRSKARASKGLWEDALTDANEVTKLDPSSYLGYELKYVALHGAKSYGEATDAVDVMLSLVGKSSNKESCDLRSKYTSPQDITTAIDVAIRDVEDLCPRVLIDLTTGQLSSAEERTHIFKSETSFKKLVSETVTQKIDSTRIRQTVAAYFQWVMFSHTWEGKEPTFKDVNSAKSIRNLDQSPLNEKLRRFCATARKNGHRWAWSDTCCIDKDTNAVLVQSLTSMYRWYAEATETLVYLSDVPPGSASGSLSRSRWMTRAWTLQELLASKVVRFYDNTWELYLHDTTTNHKESSVIKGELAATMGLAPETITRFQPENLGVREKLRLASKRDATVVEDIAYSLIGIFSSDIAPRYGLGKTALGQLLESIVTRSGDVAVIAWTGEPLPYNSAIPCSLSVYEHTPFSTSFIKPDEMDTLVEELQAQLPQQDALTFCRRIIQLPRATFTNRCLHLPCIVFPVKKVGIQELDNSQGILYRASISFLEEKVAFRTNSMIAPDAPRKLVFVHPWIPDLCDPSDVMSLDELDMDSSEDESDAKDADSDDTADIPRPTSALHAEPLSRPDRHVQALRMIARLGRPFSALLLERQTNGQYKRIAAENPIVFPGVPFKANFVNIRAKVLEII